MPSAGVRSFNGTILLVNGWRWWRIDWCIFFSIEVGFAAIWGESTEYTFSSRFSNLSMFCVVERKFHRCKAIQYCYLLFPHSRQAVNQRTCPNVRMKLALLVTFMFFFRRVYESIDSSSFTEQIEKQRIPFLSVSLVKSIAPRFASKVLNDIRSLFAKGGREKKSNLRCSKYRGQTMAYQLIRNEEKHENIERTARHARTTNK